MDTQNPAVDVPNLKLAKVGTNREKRRGGAGWLGARGAGSAFSGAAGGAGAGAGGGLFGTGMSLAKLLTILLVSGGISAGAWQVGNMMAASGGAAPAPKVFASKDGPQKYDDTSGVIKGGDKSIPNSLGYINNDGLTDEQRAAKKAAEAEAARKAEEDAKKAADEEAKKKALEDAKAASATPDPTMAAAGPQVPKMGLGGGKFGGMKSSFGGGGGGLSGGAGLSGGINRNFGGASGLGNKAQAGALAAFRSPSKAATTRAAGPTRGKSNSKGFAKQQLDNANGMSRTAAATGKSETASAGAATPFDNNGAQGSVISGPGLGSGTQVGPADSGGATNPNTGGSGPVGNGAACQDANFEPDVNGNCVQQTPNPTGQNAAPYQGLLDGVMVLLGIIMVLSLIAMIWSKVPIWGTTLGKIICGIIAVLGLAVAGMGAAIATMKHGDFMIGGIVGVVGLAVAASAAMSFGEKTSSMSLIETPAIGLVAAAAGELAAMSGKSKQASMQ